MYVSCFPIIVAISDDREVDVVVDVHNVRDDMVRVMSLVWDHRGHTCHENYHMPITSCFSLFINC